jgi:hypothetical protein
VRRNSGIAAVVGLIAILLSPICAPATAPIARDLPDIRNAIDAGGNQALVLDLDDYVLDPNDRDPNTSAQLPLTWGENGSNTAISTINQVTVTVPASAAPSDQTVTFDVDDGVDDIPLQPIRVHTSDILLGGPLVDTQLGDGSGSEFPYGWCGEPGSGTFRVDIQSTLGAVAPYLNVTSGGGITGLYNASGIVGTATQQNNPLNWYDRGVALKDWDLPNSSFAHTAGANLSIDADLNGIFITPQTDFSGWVRVTVTRDFASGADDSYSVAVADLLTGVAGNLQGTGLGNATINGTNEVYGFDGVSLIDFLGTTSSAVFNAGTDADRHTALLNQQTSWQVIVAGMTPATGALPAGVTLPDLDITSVGKPGATYPGATNGRALKVTINGQNQRVLMTHKGIPRSQYSPGDVLTLSLNTYVDLGYNGVDDDLINEPTSAFSYIFGLASLPGGYAQTLNVINFAADTAAFAPLRKGAAGGVNFGRGGGQMLNPLAIVNGKWTRQEVTMRVPELGQTVNGPGPTDGNTVDSLGMTAVMYFGNFDISAGLPDQTLWLDNICIADCPGALALAQGAINVPMIASGFCAQFNNGADAGPGAFFVTMYGGDSVPLPANIARGEAIYGSFSQGSGGTVTATAPTTTWGTSALTGHAQALNNANAGWMEAAVAVNADLASIGEGGLSVALGFPTMPVNNRSLLLGPAPASISGNAFTTNVHPAGATRLGNVEVATPWLDMRLASDAVLPGLHVADVSLPGTGGNPNGENGDLNPNEILQNISGVFGVRWFTTSNAASVVDNGRMDVTLLNADVNLGLVANCPSVILPSADNVGMAVPSWSDNFVSGTFLTFNSYGKYYDQILNSGAGGRPGMQGAGSPALATALLLENPGAQLADIRFIRSNDNATGLGIQSIVNNTLANGFEGIYAAGDDGPISSVDVLPGRYSNAVIAIDEVNLYGVRDIAQFYDEDLEQSVLLP